MVKQTMTRTRWFKFDFNEQMANVGAEIGRTINWRNKNQSYSRMAFDRGIILLELTLQDPKNRFMMDELQSKKKLLVDWFQGNKVDPSTDKKWEDYFYTFNYAAGLKRT